MERKERKQMNRRKTMYFLNYTGMYEEALRRYKELMIIRRKIEEKLENAPQGIIRISTSDRQPQFYLKKDKSDTHWKYISKTEKTKLKQYVQKSYDEKIYKLVDGEIHALERLLVGSDDKVERIRKTYSNYPDEVKAYIDPIDMSDEDYSKLWESIPYEEKEISGVLTVYETKRGERVRSKSELNIANALAAKGIPYKYECPLILKNGTKLHPDFTVLNVKKRKQIYWEHRGMMDDKDYATRSVLRIKTYMKNGIVIGDELIITEETSANPLGTNEIDGIIDRFCL